MKFIKLRWKWVVALLTGFLLWFILILTLRFSGPTSTVVFSEEGELLGARIADDGQWRFPVAEKIPDNYRKALLMYEDRSFYFHPGVNPVALVRALFLNLKYKKFVSGGSTLTMRLPGFRGKTRPGTLPEHCLRLTWR